MNSEGQALFRALCEHPTDDTPRLVYADWLEENDDPERAEFIRLQCERWNLCPAYPTVTAARTRASTLLRQYRDWWYADLPDLAGVAWGGLYIRGFVDKAHINSTADVVETLKAVFTATPLQHLSVSLLEPRQLHAVLKVPQLARLRWLRLPDVDKQENARLLHEAQVRFPDTEIT